MGQRARNVAPGGAALAVVAAILLATLAQAAPAQVPCRYATYDITYPGCLTKSFFTAAASMAPMVYSKDEQGNWGQGSGWTASPWQVVTAKHVTRGRATVIVEFSGRAPAEADVACESGWGDLAIVRLRSAAGRWFEAKEGAGLPAGQRVAAMGYPNKQWMVVGASVARYTAEDGRLIKLLLGGLLSGSVDAFLSTDGSSGMRNWGGMSGGPVVAEDGKVVAGVVGGIMQISGTALQAAPLDWGDECRP